MAILPYFHDLVQVTTIINPLYTSLFFFSIVVLLKLTTNKKKEKKLNFPPSPPRLPLIGNIHQLGTNYHRSLQALSKKHGPLMLLQLGYVRVLVVSSSDMAREMMRPLDILFAYRPHTTFPKLALYGCKDIFFAPYGEDWRQSRKLSTIQLLSAKKVQSLHYLREEETEKMVDKIRRCYVDSKVVNLSEFLLSISNNITCRAVLGKRFEDEHGKNKCAELTRRLTVQILETCFGDFFPHMGWIDSLTGLMGKFKASAKEADDLLETVVQELKVKNIDSDHHLDDEHRGEKCFIYMLLQLHKDGMLDFDPTYTNLKGIVLDMIIAGTDTTAVALEWSMAELIRNPNAMKRVQEEIRRVMGTKTKIGVNEVNQMNYLDCVVKESLRLHPPLPLSLPREVPTSIKMASYDIPSNTQVFVNVYAIQRDPKVWEKPDDFIPERFISNPLDILGQHFEYIPFGSGRRICPGNTLAFVTTKYVLSHVLYWFDWKLPEGCKSTEDLDMDESFGITVPRKLPLLLKPIPYTP